MKQFFEALGLQPTEDYRARKMTFGKKSGKPDKTLIVYNSRITLTGVPLDRVGRTTQQHILRQRTLHPKQSVPPSVTKLVHHGVAIVWTSPVLITEPDPFRYFTRYHIMRCESAGITGVQPELHDRPEYVSDVE